MGLWIADADRVAAAEVLDELRTLPFLAERRVVLMKQAGDFISKNRSALEAYFDNPCESGILVMTVESWPKNTKLAKKLNNAGQLVAVEDIKPWKLAGYICDYTKQQHEKTISKAAAELLVELVGDEPGRLVSEADKLATYKEGSKTISPQDVEALIGHNRIFNIFAVIDAMTQGNGAGATLKLRKIFEMDKNAGK